MSNAGRTPWLDNVPFAQRWKGGLALAEGRAAISWRQEAAVVMQESRREHSRGDYRRLEIMLSSR